MGAVAALTVAGTACGGTAAPPAPVLSGPATRYLLRLDDLPVPGFTVSEAPHAAVASDVAPAGVGGSVLSRAGMRSGARARYLLPAPELSTANGPLDVVAVVEVYGTAAGASSAYAAEIAALDSATGAQQVSTGPLGDAGHAVSREADGPAGVRVVEYTVEWRVAQAVNRVVVRGRAGGLDLSGALIVARRQLQREGG